MDKKEYVHRMLAYWDPWGLISNNGAPTNEYDTYIEKIILVSSLSTQQEISLALTEIFDQPGMPNQNLARAIEGMTEGVWNMKNS